jgi:hypothetical protein
MTQFYNTDHWVLMKVEMLFLIALRLEHMAQEVPSYDTELAAAGEYIKEACLESMAKDYPGLTMEVLEPYIIEKMRLRMDPEGIE